MPFQLMVQNKNYDGRQNSYQNQPEDHWSFSAHLSAEDMLKSAVNEEKKFKQSDFIHIFSWFNKCI